MKKIIHFVLLCFLTAIVANAQIKSHQIGRLWLTMFPAGAEPAYSPINNKMNYPGGDFLFHTRQNMDKLGTWIGVKNFTDKFDRFHSFYVLEGGYLNADAPDIQEQLSNKKYVRQRLPLVDVNDQREQRILENRSDATRQVTLLSDEKIVTKWATDVGILVTRTSYAFANRRHDNYIIQEYLFENSGDIDGDGTPEFPDQILEDVYFGFWRSLVPSRDIGHEEMGGQFDDWCHYYGNQPGDSLRGFWYAYDGDGNRKAIDDIGDPAELTGEFLSTAYTAFGLLHADTDYANETDDPSQPATINFWPRSRVHSTTKGDPFQTLYLDLSSRNQSMGSDMGPFAEPYDANIQRPDLLMSFGPYDLPFNENVRIVIYEAVGSIDRDKAIQYGHRWLAGDLEWNGRAGDEAKNAIIATGLDSLHKAVDNAEITWAMGIESVPDGPESPNLRINAGPAKIELEWYYGNFGAHDSIPPTPDPDTGKYDFAGYKVFRAEESSLNPYKQIFQCGGDTQVPVTNKYIDRNVERGKSYYYYVVSYDDGSQNSHPNEFGKPVDSSHMSNRNYQFPGVPFVGAYPHLDSVYVVPNPFHAQGLEYGGTLMEDYIIEPDIGARIEDRLTFVGLPAKATLRIFTAHGDLVATLLHPDPTNPRSLAESADEMWFQITGSHQTIKSGVYFFHVEGWDVEDNFLGTTTGKFVVIR